MAVLTRQSWEHDVYGIDTLRNFFVEAVASRIARDASLKRIESMCESNFDRLPQDGGIIYLNLYDADGKP
jgi:hypothetical protein